MQIITAPIRQRKLDHSAGQGSIFPERCTILNEVGIDYVPEVRQISKKEINTLE